TEPKMSPRRTDYPTAQVKVALPDGVLGVSAGHGRRFLEDASVAQRDLDLRRGVVGAAWGHLGLGENLDPARELADPWIGERGELEGRDVSPTEDQRRGHGVRNGEL